MIGRLTRAATPLLRSAAASKPIFPSARSDAASLAPMSTKADWPAFETRAGPAPGAPFHLALPVHCMDAARDFYGRIMGCEEGRSSLRWQDCKPRVFNPLALIDGRTRTRVASPLTRRRCFESVLLLADSLHGHQLVCHWAGDDYRCTDYYNPVDGDEASCGPAGGGLRTSFPSFSLLPPSSSPWRPQLQSQWHWVARARTRSRCR